MQSKSAMVMGTPSKVFWNDFRFYVLIQLLILVKVVLLFFWLGQGISYRGQPTFINLPFIAVPAFGSIIHVLDYAFHQLMHVSIALWVFLLAKHMHQFKPFSIFRLFLVASLLHNVGYWITKSHPSWAYSLQDYVTDFVALWAFFGLFWLAMKFFPALFEKQRAKEKHIGYHL